MSFVVFAISIEIKLFCARNIMLGWVKELCTRGTLMSKWSSGATLCTYLRKWVKRQWNPAKPPESICSKAFFWTWPQQLFDKGYFAFRPAFSPLKVSRCATAEAQRLSTVTELRTWNGNNFWTKWEFVHAHFVHEQWSSFLPQWHGTVIGLLKILKNYRKDRFTSLK